MKSLKHLVVALALALALALGAGAARADEQAAAPQKYDGVAQWLAAGTAQLHLRSFYMNRHFDQRGGTQQALALGGWLFYETAPLYGLSVGAAGYTSQPIAFTDEDQAGTNLLSDDQEGISVLGKLYLKGSWMGTTITLGRQELDTPFLNAYDCRMIPVLYEAYVIENNSVKGLKVQAGYVNGFKSWNDTVFQPMSEAVGDADAEEGVIYAGVEYSPTKNYSFQIYQYFAQQMANMVYGEADGNWDLNQDWNVALSLQGVNQNDAGEAIAGRFNAWQVGAQTVITYKGLAVSLGYTTTGPDAPLFNPWSGWPIFTSIMEEDNNRADDNCLLAGLAYDFGMVGPGGLSFNSVFTYSNTPDSGVNASPDQWEADLNVDYRFKGGALDGLWVRLRGANVNQDATAGGQQYSDFRVIFNYEFNLL